MKNDIKRGDILVAKRDYYPQFVIEAFTHMIALRSNNAVLTWYDKQMIEEAIERGEWGKADPHKRIPIFVYERFMRNKADHFMLGSNSSYLGEDTIKGALFTTRTIVYLFRGKDIVKGEIYEIGESEFLCIKNMMEASNYKPDVVKLMKTKQEAITFFAKDPLLQLKLEKYE